MKDCKKRSPGCCNYPDGRFWVFQTTVALAESTTAGYTPTVLITGGNRGLGLEFTRQYAAMGWNVIATARKPDAAEALQALAAEHANISMEQLDVNRLCAYRCAGRTIQGSADRRITE